MKINFTGNLEAINAGLEHLRAHMDIKRECSGFPVHVTEGGCGLSLDITDGHAEIRYQDKSDFFRAFSYLKAHQSDSCFHIQEKKSFDTVCVMVDTSRNAVPTVEAIKRLLRAMALMGLNMFMLYTEDTYEVPGEPYMGYMRGAYTYDELKECDDYAYDLGIEMVPCIQTLAHLPRLLQWKCYENISDTEDIMLVGEPETYLLIEKMITAAAAPFRSKRIHIGMDEAHMIGLGKYLSLHGPQKRFEILTEHLNKVTEITRRHGLTPMMWSDMFFRLISPSADYADVEIPREIVDRIPQDLQLVYWDYYNAKKKVYLTNLYRHEQMKNGTIFAGGIWTWNGTSVSHNKSIITTLPALEACREIGIKEVIITLWGDDGAETDIFQALLGIQLYAEINYSTDTPDMGIVQKRFQDCTGGDPQAFLDLDRLDNVKGDPCNGGAINISKLALYQDVMIGLFDYHLEGLNLAQHYEQLTQVFKAHAEAKNPWAYLFTPLTELCKVLSLKADIGIELKAAYDLDDREKMRKMLPKLEKIRENMLNLKQSYRELWLHDFKAFGFEVFDIRLGGVIARIEYAQGRVKDYLLEKVERLEELEVTRLPHDRRMCELGSDGLCRFNRWHQTVTTSYIGHNIP